MHIFFISKWKVIKTIWPYEEGYGIYRENHITGQRTLLDSGLTKEQAEEECRKLNNKNK